MSVFKKSSNEFLINFTCISILLVILIYVLKSWAALLIPFIVALLFSFAIIALSNFYKKLKIPTIFSFILSFATYIFIFWLIWKMIGSNIDELRKLLPVYQSRIIEIYHYVFEYLKITEPESITEIMQQINLQSIFTNVIAAFTSIFSKMWLITFFSLFILLESKSINKKIYLMIKDNSKDADILEILERIRMDVKSYFVVKTYVSLITAILCYLVMLLFGLDFAIFWALLVFLLNYIPSIGSIIAVFLPALLSLVQPGFNFSDSLILTTLLTTIQVLMWNVVEPQFMWNKLNLSPLVIIISLAFWWMIWWVVWMLLSVPIMVIINIILSKIPATRPIAILLSEKWDIQVNSWEEIVKNRKKILKSFKDKLDSIEVRKKK